MLFGFPLFAVIVGGLVASVAYLVNSVRGQGRMQVWRTAAERAQLTDVTARSELFRQSLHGRAQGLPVTMTNYRRGKHERGTRIQVDTGGRFSIRLEGVGTSLAKRFVGLRELEVGDDSFDQQCFIEAPGPLALALLTPEVRLSLPFVLRGHVPLARSSADVRTSLTNGVLQVDLREQWFSPGFLVPELLQGVIEVAHRLAVPADLAARLASNFHAEPLPGVRLQLLLTLAREYPDHPGTREVLLAASGDASDEIRLRAALALGEAGRPALLALVARPDAEDACRARAITELGEQLSTEQLLATLRESASTRGARTACACVEALAGRAAEGVEPMLVEQLQDLRADVRLAAVRALGKAGSASSVPSLRELATTQGELRGAARQAIAEIQSRLPGAGPGQLSLAGGDAGALSLADAEPGRLSLSKEHDPLPLSSEPQADVDQRNPPPVRQRSKA